MINNSYYQPCFKARIAVGGEINSNVNDTPYCFLSLKAKEISIPEVKRHITSEEASELHANIISHINKLQLISGPINPSLKENETNFSIENQAIGKPPSIDAETREKHIRFDKDTYYKFQKAGEEFEAKFNTEIENLNKSSKESPEKLKNIIKLNDFLAKGMEMEINLESGILDKIAKSDASTIFISNHNHVPYDISLAFGTISELYKSYETNGKKENLPKPAFMINKVVTDTLPEKFKEVFDNIESLGVDSTPYPTKEGAEYNNQKMKPIIEGFTQNKTNLFLFPEGTRTAYNGKMPFENRFQYGIAKLIQDAVQKKGSVRVISLGIDFDDKLGAVNIGEPIYFVKDGDKIKVTKGNITSDTEAAKTNSFYKKLSTLKESENLTICHKGKPVLTTNEQSSKFMSRLIAGILCTDLDISMKNASKMLRGH